jgi:hypothetical protein
MLGFPSHHRFDLQERTGYALSQGAGLLLVLIAAIAVSLVAPWH